MLSAKGRTFTNGKALDEDTRSNIIDSIVKQGRDNISGFFAGNFSQFGKTYNVSSSGQTVTRCENVLVRTQKLDPETRKVGKTPLPFDSYRIKINPDF